MSMLPSFKLKCTPCGTTHYFETTKEKSKHKRNVTVQIASTYYANSPGSSEATLHNILRDVDGAFHCILCSFTTMNSESMRKHPKYCPRDATKNDPPSQASILRLSVPSKPPPISRSLLKTSSSSPPSSALLETLPLSTPASSLMSVENSVSKNEPVSLQSIPLPTASSPSLIRTLPFSDELNVLTALPNSLNTASAVSLPSLLFSSSSRLQQAVTIATAPGLPPLPTSFLTLNTVQDLLPPTTSSSATSMSTVPPTHSLHIPLFDRDIAMDLKETLDRLRSACALCWMRKQPCSHGLWDCSHNQVNKYATGADGRYRDFRDGITCSSYSHCYGCYIPQKSSYANHGRTIRFHPSGYGRKNCMWKDTLLPLAYLVFISASVRKLFAAYDNPRISFTSASQTEFLDWFINTDDSEKLPPALFILYVLKNEFGMPPPLPQCSNPVTVDPFA